MEDHAVLVHLKLSDSDMGTPAEFDRIADLERKLERPLRVRVLVSSMEMNTGAGNVSFMHTALMPRSYLLRWNPC
jgi:hypothetical protein